MEKKTNRIVLLLALLLCALGAKGDEKKDTMYVVLNSGIVQSYPVDTVNKVVYANDGKITGLTSCPDNKHPHAIDMGLGVKWACCNVGSKVPGDYGSYYAWGETVTKSEYSSANSTSNGENASDIKGTDNDVAHMLWGYPWVMPESSDFNELLDATKCKWEWVSASDGIGFSTPAGYKVVSKKTSGEIFLPAAGWHSGSSLYHAGSYGHYWSSTPYSNAYYAYGLRFGSGYHGVGDDGRNYGFSVRPVCP